LKKLTLLLTEDETLVRQGFAALLRQEPFCDTLYEAGTGSETLSVLTEKKIDILLLDIKLPDIHGLEIVKRMHHENIKTKILVITGLEGHELLLNLLHTGIDGFVPKINGFDEVCLAIRQLQEDGVYFSHEVHKLTAHLKKSKSKAPAVHLNEKDKVIIESLLTGQTTKQLAGKLNMSERTAETYRRRLLQKTGTVNTATLIAYGFRNGII